MRGKVVNGRVEVEDFELPEGADVGVLLHEDEEEHVMSLEQEAELEAALDETDRGEGIPGAEQVLRELRELREHLTR
jgi:hypothetical protein